MTARQPATPRMLENRRLIRKVPCPRCGAPIGGRCSSPKGRSVVPDHQERRHAAAEAGVYQP